MMLQMYSTGIRTEILFLLLFGLDTGEKAYFYDKILRLCGIDQEKVHMFKC